MLDNYEITKMVMDGCGHCANARKRLKDKILSGVIKIRNINKDESALKLANSHNVTEVPTIIMKDKATHFTEACSLSPDAKKIICKHKEVAI